MASKSFQLSYRLALTSAMSPEGSYHINMNIQVIRQPKHTHPIYELKERGRLDHAAHARKSEMTEIALKLKPVTHNSSH